MALGLTRMNCCCWFSSASCQSRKLPRPGKVANVGCRHTAPTSTNPTTMSSTRCPFQAPAVLIAERRVPSVAPAASLAGLHALSHCHVRCQLNSTGSWLPGVHRTRLFTGWPILRQRRKNFRCGVENHHQVRACPSARRRARQRKGIHAGTDASGPDTALTPAPACAACLGTDPTAQGKPA